MLFTHFSPHSVESGVHSDLAQIATVFTDVFLPAGTGSRMSGDSMRITYLGHAGLRVDGADLRLLMDPWLSEPGRIPGGLVPVPRQRSSRPAGPAGLRLRHGLARAPRSHGHQPS